MANTDKQNFRCDTATRWNPFGDKVRALADAGYLMPDGRPVDMTAVLNAEVTRVLDETREQTVKRLGLVKR